MFKHRLGVAALLAGLLVAAGCGTEDGGAAQDGAQVTVDTWEPEYRGGKLQPLPDGFPNSRLTILNPDEPSSSDGLYARVLQRALNDISPERVQVVDRPNPEFGTWTSLESVQREEEGKEGYTSLVAAFTGAALDFLTVPITPDLGFTIEDMNPVIATERVPFVVIVPADAPWNTYEELVADAKASPGELRYLALGTGSQLDIAMERLMAEGGWEAEKVPLEDPVQITTTIAAGEGDFAMMLPDVALGQVEAGRVKVLLSVGDEASEPWTDATTTADLGLDEPWGSLRGVMVPSEVPELRRAWLYELYRKATESEEYKERIAETPGAQPLTMGHDEVMETVRNALDLAEPLIRDLGLHYDQQ